MYRFTIKYLKNAETTICEVFADTQEEAIQKVNKLMGSEPYSNTITNVEESAQPRKDK